ncbi:hypothetical protein MKQ70_03800 [Chitinophaga sedimenti]|uniref:hypothetical protein n=1 Tax=Chitinophaga sedimenti TaxID=2033606 RepID=UPI002006A486|nr:hypothetical protein [Chitinophaga sedimenti]MCK7554177.1 hypothetical protein [Chitinophaga sedimenti]
MEKGLKNDPFGFFVEPVPGRFGAVPKHGGANKHLHLIYFLMKCSFIFLVAQLTFVSMLLASHVKSQDLSARIPLHLEKSSVRESLLRIEQQSGVRFVLPEALLAAEGKKVTLHDESIMVKDALSDVFNGTQLEYRLLNGRSGKPQTRTHPVQRSHYRR